MASVCRPSINGLPPVVPPVLIPYMNLLSSTEHRLADDAAIASEAADEKEAEAESIALFGAASADLEAPVEELRLGRKLTPVEKMRLQYDATMGEIERVKKDKADAREAVHDRAKAKQRAADTVLQAWQQKQEENAAPSSWQQHGAAWRRQQQQDENRAEESARRKKHLRTEQLVARVAAKDACAEEAARCTAEWQEWQRRGSDVAAKRRRANVHRALLRRNSDGTIISASPSACRWTKSNCLAVIHM